MQRRLSIRNDVCLYTRKCDYSGKEVLSMYSPDKPYKIYDQTVWWQDVWDPMDYGRDFDFSRSFFEQFSEIQKEVPRMSLNSIDNDNSYYTNYSLKNKDSYLVHTANQNEDCYYLRPADRNFACCDCAYTYDSTKCYEATDAYNCTQCEFVQKCHNSSGLIFSYNMRSCHDCIFCANLNNKRYFVFNKQVSKEEFEKFKKDLNLGSYENLQKNLKEYEKFLNTQPRKYLELLQCENSYGDYLKNCKNAKYCFDCYNLEDVKYTANICNVKDSYDWNFIGDGELCYELSSSAEKLFNLKFCMNCWVGNRNLEYCDLCLNNSDCFGCVGLRHKKYCILNKQYEKEEYEALKEKIIAHMKKTGEYGEFFPISISPYGYNETVAQEYYPLTKEEALKKGYKWQDINKKEFQKQTYLIPDNIIDVPDSMPDKTLACETCGKNFRIIPQELKFYRETKLPIPHICFNCRNNARTLKRNKRILYKRNCSKCNKEIRTSYSPKTIAPVYCEKCYLDAIN